MKDANEELTALAHQVASLAMERRVTLATAESCTTGLVAHLLGRTAGVSAVLLGGIVAYSNEAKRDLLAVPGALLEEFGAVSEPVALAMAHGARARLGAQLAVSTTGIAGPGGGSAAKPVGLVYVGLSGPRGDWCAPFRFSGSRLENMEQAAREALRLLYGALSTDPG